MASDFLAVDIITIPPISWGDDIYKDVSILKITLKDGRIGLGSAYTSSKTLESVWQQYHHHIDFYASNVNQVHVLITELCSKGLHETEPDLIPALSALDIALWDLYGQELGKPICELVGTPTDSRIKAYASLEIPLPFTSNDFSEYERALKAMLAKNFKAIKLYFPRLGYREKRNWSRAEWDKYEASLFAKARDIVGSDIDLMLDVYGSADDWHENMEWAEQTAKRLTDYGFLWFEEPLLADNLEGYKQLTKNSSIAISACEFFTNPKELTHWADEKAVSILQPDCTCSGGISTLVTVRDAALQNNLTMIPHGWSTAIGMAADIQVMATMPESPFRMVEYMPKPSVTALLDGNPLILDEDGMITIPSSPGLGVCLSSK
ncbi:MAG: mandelate racemase/muconate lactonizing enzyme family protein [Rickettsiales bacterium]|nr:mandelate racemase/muconate lactonizing enzyme family protein [Rickettsiales bacterium]